MGESGLEVVSAWLDGWRPRIALVLGSGLGDLGEQLGDARCLGYDRIPGFELAGVAGHRGELIAGMLGGQRILAQSGRFHGYEGHAPGTVAAPVRLFADLGIEILILTNAAGGIGAGLGPGRIMLITDQINFTFSNPLLGPVRRGDLRFPDMSAPFDHDLQRLARVVSSESAVDLAEGCYAGVMGPSYETRSEIAMLRRLGADAVGMSTVGEVIAARAAGLRCLAFSIVTNRAAGLGAGELSHDDVMREAHQAGGRLARLMTGIMERLPGLPYSPNPDPGAATV